MNKIITSTIFLICFCVVNGDEYVNCSKTLSAFPPDPETRCCGLDASSGSKIIEGNQTRIDQYPWLALIEYDQNGEITVACGGALISNRYVLSAAYCVKAPFGKILNIRLGEYDTSNEGPDCQTVEAGGLDCTEGTISIPAEKTIVHPEYKNSRGPRWHDIALIRMARAAPYTDFIRPICLPSVDMTLSYDAFRLIKSGWGQVSGLSNIKVKVELPFVKQQDCQKALSNFKQVSLEKGQFCAGGELGKDSCVGDGGMPLMYQNLEIFEAIGIVSFGAHPCGQKNIPSVYTNIYEYKSWILNTIEA